MAVGWSGGDERATADADVPGIEKAYRETIAALARAVEARDHYTGAHVERVRRHSMSVARCLGLDATALRHLDFGALLHDVGKIGVPDAVLGKDGPLDAVEWDLMRQHPVIGREVLAGIGFLAPALDAVAYHHERWDGRGYPDGLAGNAIPLLGRIVGVVDAYDAMTSDRPYRAGMPAADALAEIERGRGRQFDPVVVDAFMACVHAPPAA
jgi:HD-GYP domain-containing protein (c-di-GMP phosphodiesterase class II)